MNDNEDRKTSISGRMMVAARRGVDQAQLGANSCEENIVLVNGAFADVPVGRKVIRSLTPAGFHVVRRAKTR